MTGYVRPLKGELKISDYERYRGVYCALCRTLRRRGGPLARLTLQYDMVVPVLVLWQGEGTPCFSCRRCPVHPLRGRACLEDNPSLDLAADVSLILADEKLLDDIADEGWFRSLLCRAARLLLRPAVRRARRARPAFSRRATECMRSLRALESARCASPDRLADGFASLLASMAEEVTDPVLRRVAEQIFYHLGRFVYWLDAADDWAEDIARGRFNPLAERYPGRAPAEALSLGEVENSLMASLQSMRAALALLPDTCFTPLLTNLFGPGLETAAFAVLSPDKPNGKKSSQKGELA